eukprot:TRINITY_DN12186_c1_g3_i3.p1 TRINITY_DN12186_c1_g3~~TRINITY_DN12186_c1_g3_i3.p1  ORF type:complete len:1047 (+),score=201.58 TRINITY_DN12186_c1_g3_i3:34-3174(+)
MAEADDHGDMTLKPPSSRQWACPRCTLLNNAHLSSCTLCKAPKPASQLQPSSMAKRAKPTKAISSLPKAKRPSITSKRSSQSKRFGSRKQGTKEYLAIQHLVQNAFDPLLEAEGWPKLLGSTVICALATRTGKDVFKTTDEIEFKYFPPGKLQSTIGAVRVRVNDRDMARISHETALWLGPLLAVGAISVTGSYIDAPRQVKMNSTVMLNVNVFGLFDAFNQLPSVQTEPNESNATGDAIGMLAFAWQRCLSSVGLTHESAPVSATTDAAPRKDDVEGEDDNNVNDEQDLQFVCEQMGQSDADLPEREPADCFKSTLRPYQKQALGWLVEREELANTSAKAAATLHPLWTKLQFAQGEVFYWKPASGQVSVHFPSAAKQSRGGILADAMGLGKTVQTLALVATLPATSTFMSTRHGGQHVDTTTSTSISPSGPPSKRSKPLTLSSFLTGETGAAQPDLHVKAAADKGSLIACKATLIVCPMSLLSQWQEEADTHVDGLKTLIYHGSSRGMNVEVFATEYDIILTTYGTLNSECLQSQQGTATLAYSVHFWRVVLDEGHMIRNRSTGGAKACHSLSAERRWVLTGTPIQNRLEDVFSLIKFLQVEPYCFYSYWKQQIEDRFAADEVAGIQALQTVLTPLLLRRTKHTKGNDGKPIVTLPSSHVEVVRLTLTSAEHDFYSAIYNQSKTKFNEFQAAGKVMNNYANILELLLRLRQACDHPFLTLKACSGGTASGSPVKKNKSKSSGTILKDIDALVAVFMSKSNQQPDLSQDHVQRMAGDLRSLFSHQSDTDHEEQASVEELPECAVCLEVISQPVVTPCAHYGCLECMKDTLAKFGCCPICRKVVSHCDLLQVQAYDHAASRAAAAPQMDAFRMSTKLSALKMELERIRGENDADKCIVFSQWTSMLDLVETVLSKAGIAFVRLDGSMSQSQRSEVLERFKTDPNVAVFLMTLRTGGVGLNLTSAQHVLLLDPWWSPAVEAQAIDRVHRIGQKRAVSIKRFIIADSVEEKILDLQKRKRALVHNALGRNNEERRSEAVADLELLFSA